jgi:uncharacterized protein (TIGR03382 family)
VLPSVDGGAFTLSVEEGIYPGTSTKEILAALDEILPATGFHGRTSDLYPAVEGVRQPGPDLDALREEATERMTARLAEVQREVGLLDKDALALLQEEAEEAYDHAAEPVELWRFDVYVDGARTDGHSVLVFTDGRSIRRVVGALYGDTTASNRARLDADEATRAALTFAGDARLTVAPELVLVADGATLRNTWRMVVTTAQGPYGLWVDAETGDVVQVEPRFSSASAQGARTAASIPLSTSVVGFSVDDDDDCDAELELDCVLDLDNNGASGFDDDVTACKQNGVMRFDTAAISSTTNVTNAMAANYNPQFQQVNAYAWSFSALKFYKARGSQDLPEWEVNVNDDDPCGFGIDNACGTDGELTLGLGGKTAGVAGGKLVDTALDPTVIVHEIGHGINRIQNDVGDGALNSSLDEGVADYWAMSHLNTNIVGVVTRNTTSDVESGFLPRKATAQDVFPDHLGADGFSNNEVHANGQIVANALFGVRTEIDERLGAGPQVTDTALMTSMLSAGIGEQNSTWPGLVHDAYWSLMMGMLIDQQSTKAAEDVLVGFARAGIFVEDKTAVIDIDKDVLDGNTGAPPVFTVWTGRDYLVAGLIAIPLNQFNTQYEVEVATNSKFTDDLVSSGPQTNIVAASNSAASGQWQLPQKDWDNMRYKSQLFFRVTTSTPGVAGSTRISTLPASILPIPASRAVINHPGGVGCSTVPGSTASFVGILAGLAAMVRRRRA